MARFEDTGEEMYGGDISDDDVLDLIEEDEEKPKRKKVKKKTVTVRNLETEEDEVSDTDDGENIEASNDADNASEETERFEEGNVVDITDISRTSETKKPSRLPYAIGGVALATALIVGGIFTWKALRPEPAVSMNSVVEVDPDSPYSQENIIQQLDEQQLPMYEFLIQGNFTAVDTDADTGKSVFQFDGDKRFFGRSSYEPDDLGKYELTAESGNIVLTVKCINATDRYLVTLSDTDNLVLAEEESGKIYSLIPD